MQNQIETRLQYVVRRLREVTLHSWPDVSKKSGVPHSTIYKIAYRETKDPRGSTLDALYNYFSEVEK